ncbi:MAG TPA: hypothetical protein VMU00_06080 [Steroidobacteraceae bacterium]|nr:hypothetical protein [Steroidobacteraceae bacterium]
MAALEGAVWRLRSARRRPRPEAFAALVAGGSCGCRGTVTHRAGEASRTIIVFGQRTVDRGTPLLVEVGHFTLGNGGYVDPAAKRAGKPATTLVLTPPGSAPK